MWLALIQPVVEKEPQHLFYHNTGSRCPLDCNTGCCRSRLTFQLHWELNLTLEPPSWLWRYMTHRIRFTALGLHLDLGLHLTNLTWIHYNPTNPPFTPTGHISIHALWIPALEGLYNEWLLVKKKKEKDTSELSYIHFILNRDFACRPNLQAIVYKPCLTGMKFSPNKHTALGYLSAETSGL